MALPQKRACSNKHIVEKSRDGHAFAGADSPEHCTTHVAISKGYKTLGLERVSVAQDEDGLWRAAGRLQHVKSLPRDARAPIILPKGSRPLALLLRHFHSSVLVHVGGVSHVLSRFQARFYAPHARKTAYFLLKNCVDCRRRLARPLKPKEGPLPSMRLPKSGEDGRAFAVTAVDCAGPYRVKRGRSYEMHYMLLITCCSLRAVRIELLSDLTVDAFLLALSRATSRGVNPHTILSDNGGNFDGANRLLRALWLALPQSELQARRPEVTWRFNPPYASHFGGVFERLVGAAKQALYHALPAHVSLSFEQLLSAFAHVEAILNSRPLAYVSTDPKDISPLTPNHFLYGSASVPLITLDEAATMGKRWSVLRNAVPVFLKQLEKELRPHLMLSSRLRSQGRDLAVGDVVAFFLPSSAKKWPLARVEQVHPGKDGKVRVVDLLLPNSSAQQTSPAILRRDVGQVALLLPADQPQHPSWI